MDLLEIKSRIAEALVESIFRRARWEVRPFKGDPLPLRFGRENFSPDFWVAQKPGDGPEQQHLIEVKYRPSIEQFISVENQRGERSVFFLAHRHWPALYFVLVTERPEAGRSCFQVLPFTALKAGDLRTVDLAHLEEFRLFPNNIDDHEQLARSIFGLLAG